MPHRARSPLDGSAWPARRLDRRRLRLGPDRVGGRRSRGSSGTSRRCRSTSRASCSPAPTAPAPRVVAGGGPVSVGQPRFSPDGTRLAYVSDATGWWNVVGRGRRRLRTRARCSRRPTTTRRRRGRPGQRSFAWSPDGTEIAICRNEDGFGRLIVVPVRSTARRTDVRELVEGLAPLARLGTGRDRRASARARARRRPSPSIDPDTADRARARTRRARRASSARPSSPSRSRGAAGRDRARAALPAGRVRARAGRRRRRCSCSSTAARPTRPPRAGSRASRTSSTAAGRCCAPTTAARPASGASTRRRSASGGASSTSSTPRPASAPRSSAAGATPTGSRSWAAARAGSRRCSCARSTARWCAPGVSLFGVTEPVRPRRDHPPARVALRRLAGRCAPRRDADRYVEHSPVTHAAAIKVPLLVLQGDADNVVPPAQAQVMVDAVRGARRDGRAPRLRGRGPRLVAAGDDDRRARARRRVPDPMGAAPMTLEYEYQGPKRGADRAVLLAHGAGADMHAKALTAVADALADGEDPVAAVQVPVPDRGEEGARPSAGARWPRPARRPPSCATRTKLPPERLVLGGRSMGGRYCSLVAGDEDDPVAVPRASCCSATRCTRRASRRSSGSSTSRASRCRSRS